MTAEPARNLDAIVSRAAELGPRERLAYLKHACGNDTPLFDAALERLSASWLLDLEEGAQLDGDDAAPAARRPGEEIGPWRVVRILGRGGMGEVYLCERADEQYRKQVAIKLVGSGLISRQVQTRLRTERQILATLDHPNIARLLDGGTTADGVPYLVMEYIEGEPIDEYCDARALGIEKRIELFRVVCSAVHAAHRSLIVHRDLKPSNILVTADGTPKLLDFGIAKLLDVRQTAHTVAVTQADIRILTPDHASPEQIRGGPITTASDVYVLGVLLYELLCGRRPFRVAGLRLIEIERVICEQEAPAPSECLEREEFGGGTAEQIAGRRATTHARLRRQLRGDLDNIVRMAMRKEPDRRYGSVEQLSADIDLYLRGMPIVARRDTWGYRTRKFVQRHTLAVALSITAMLVLAGFAVAMYVQAERVREQRDRASAQYARAETERTRAERVLTFLVDIFRRADPAEARGKEMTAREILERGAHRIDVELKDEPETQAHLMDTIGRVYLAMGYPERAMPLLERALTLRRGLYGDSDVVTAESMRSLADAQLAKGELKQAEELARQSLDTQIRTYGERHEAVAQTYHSLGMVLNAEGELDAAEATYHRSLDLYQSLLGERDARVTEVMSDLASVLATRGNYGAAEQLYRRAYAVDRELLGLDHPQVVYEVANLAYTQQMQGKLDEAEPMFRESIELFRRVLGPENNETIAALGNYGRFLHLKGDLDAAEPVLREALELRRKTLGDGNRFVGYQMVSLALLLTDRGQYAEAEELLRGAIDIYKRTLEPNHLYFGSAFTGMARIYAERGDASRVTAFVERAVGIWRSELPEDDWQIANSRSMLGRCKFREHQYAEAEPILLASYQTLERQRGDADPFTRRVRGWLAALYQEWGRPQDAARYQ